MDDDWLVWRYEASRPRLRSMAYRMLGSVSDADDAVQEAWIHVAGGDASAVANLEGWFTTIVARVCLDMLRARKSRREDPVDAADLDLAAGAATDGGTVGGADAEAVLADTVGIAMLVVLDTLGPAERVAFVLHEMFGLPFAEIAAITGRSPASARQLASRARRRIRVPTAPASGTPGSGEPASGASALGEPASRASAPGVSASGVSASAASVSGASASGASAARPAELARQRALADAFLTAARGGDMKALLAVLDPDVILHGDAVASRAGKPITIRGATKVARASAASRPPYSGVALINGVPGIVHAPHGHLATVLAFRYGPRSASVSADSGTAGTGLVDSAPAGTPSVGTTVITAIDVIADPSHLATLELAVPD